MMRIKSDYITVIVVLAAMTFVSCSTERTDLLIVGGGASGVSAAVQAGRDGIRTMVIEETPWLGGMLTSAGVSAIDGNYDMRSGLFGEFTDSLAAYYGGYDRLGTGWVSRILFQPRVGDGIFKKMVAALPSVTVRYNTVCRGVRKTGDGWIVTVEDSGGKCRKVRCRLLIDGTELGDVAAMCGVPYCLGMDSRFETGEKNAPVEASDVVQDLTYVLTVKDYGPDADMTIARPKGYRPELYSNCCENQDNADVSRGEDGFFRDNATGQMMWSPERMLGYGRLPVLPSEGGTEYMLNWPIHGNDFYANVVEMDAEERAAVLDSAKRISLGYLYYMQTHLGMKNIGIAKDEYPTEDGLPFYPYYRESRRIQGVARLTMDDAANPYSSRLYRTGIAVGNYPVDHHHYRNPDWNTANDLWFYPIPSYNIPAGVIIPRDVDDIIVAEKSISVTSVMNGTTRLQPMTMQIGQAAGALASIALRRHSGNVRAVGVRELQTEILESGGYIMPYVDLPKDDPDFKALQRIGATGIMRGKGESVGWTNRTLFRADDLLNPDEVYLEEYYPGKTWEELGLPDRASASMMTRKAFAVLLDTTLHPFESFEIDWQGDIAGPRRL